MENFEKNLMLTPHYKKVITYFSKKASGYDKCIEIIKKTFLSSVKSI